MNYLPPLVLTNSSNINASIIWLHGLGADGYDFEPVALQLLQQPQLSNVRFILPHAPEMAVTRNNGYIMPAWYDVYGITPVSKEDEAGIKASQTYIESLILNEINQGISSERIVLAGFSQGGAIALYTALRYPQKLGGVLALSTYMPLKPALATEAQSANAGTPIFMAHGTFDDVISMEMCQLSLNLLKSLQYLVSWHEYNMAHSVCAQEIADIRDFLQQILPQA
ncbi:MAG: alpha/beta fold hydrolase [Pseudomonadota bacterium]